MNQNEDPVCPDGGNQIVDTREVAQPYSDFDSYTGFRCSGCKKTFTDSEIAILYDSASS